MLGVEAEIGLYAKVGGMAGQVFGNGYVEGIFDPTIASDNPRLSYSTYDKDGNVNSFSSLYFDAGWFFKIVGKVKFDLILFEVDIASVTFYEKETSFLGDNVQKQPMYHLLGEVKTNLTETNLDTPIPTITIGENGYGDVPPIYLMTYDYMNKDDYDITPLSYRECEFQQSQYVNFNSGRAYTKDSNNKEFVEII